MVGDGDDDVMMLMIMMVMMLMIMMMMMLMIIVNHRGGDACISFNLFIISGLKLFESSPCSCCLVLIYPNK